MQIKLTLELKDIKDAPIYKRTLYVKQEQYSSCGLDLDMLIDEFKRLLKNDKLSNINQ